MKTLNLDLGARSYPIYIGSGLLGQQELITNHLAGRRVMVITNETVAPLYLDKVMSSLGDLSAESLVLPDGEQYKNLVTLNRIFDALLKERYDRQTILLALGGGVIGDITGFAAAVYQRGIAFIQLPTTLLAQVDSSIGGKTGVNHPLGKNMIGAFHQPRCVIVDTDTLDTLDDRELHAGIAEIIKYGLIRDVEFFAWLEEHMEDLTARDPDALAQAIERSCRNKADVVSADEQESGQRALLNLGHTFGHAIETGMGYGTWLHGEAIAAGMLMAAKLSSKMGWISKDDVQRIEALISRASLPVRPPREIDARRFIDIMAVDKKNIGGRTRFVLLREIGKAVITDEVDESMIEGMIEEYRTE